MAARPGRRGQAHAARSTTGSCPPCVLAREMYRALASSARSCHFRSSLSAGVAGRRRTPSVLGASNRAVRGLRRARRPAARTSSTWPGTSSARSQWSRPAPRRSTRARGRRRGRVGGVVRGRRDRHDRGLAVRDRAQERVHAGRSTDPRARSDSISSG